MRMATYFILFISLPVIDIAVLSIYSWKKA